MLLTFLIGSRSLHKANTPLWCTFTPLFLKRHPSVHKSLFYNGVREGCNGKAIVHFFLYSYEGASWHPHSPSSKCCNSLCIETVHEKRFYSFLEVFFIHTLILAFDVQVKGFEWFTIRGIEMRESYDIWGSHSSCKKMIYHYKSMFYHSQWECRKEKEGIIRKLKKVDARVFYKTRIMFKIAFCWFESFLRKRFYAVFDSVFSSMIRFFLNH